MHVAGALPSSPSRLSDWLRIEPRADAWASYAALALAGLAASATLLWLA